MWWILYILIVLVVPVISNAGELALRKNTSYKQVSCSLERLPQAPDESKNQTFIEFINTHITRSAIKKSTHAVIAGYFAEQCIQYVIPHTSVHTFFPYAFAIPHALFLIHLGARTIQILDSRYPHSEIVEDYTVKNSAKSIAQKIRLLS